MLSMGACTMPLWKATKCANFQVHVTFQGVLGLVQGLSEWSWRNIFDHFGCGEYLSLLWFVLNHNAKDGEILMCYFLLLFGEFRGHLSRNDG